MAKAAAAKKASKPKTAKASSPKKATKKAAKASPKKAAKKADKKDKVKRAPSPYALFVKKHSTDAALKDLTFGERSKKMSEMWAVEKAKKK